MIEKKESVYLAGAIVDAQDPRGWRKRAAEIFNECGILPLDPFDFELEGMTDEQIVKTDLHHIIVDTDYILVNIETPSWGTAMEVYCARQHDKPVYAFGDLNLKDVSPWIRYHINNHHKKMEDAIALLIEDIDNGEI